MDTHGIEIRLLGDPAIVVGGDVRPVTRPREQAVLARLALVAPRAVPVHALVSDIWGDDPPTRAVDSLRVHVSNLRRLLAGSERSASQILVTSPGAYQLDVPAAAIDVCRLEAATHDADIDALRPLLRTWPDQDLGRFDSGTRFFDAAARRIDDQCLAGLEVLAISDLEGGQAALAVASLDLALQHAPYRERSWELLIDALAADGRRSEALRAFQRARSALAEVGMEPGAALVAAERAVLATVSPTASRALTSGYVEVDGSRVAFATTAPRSLDLVLLHGGFVPFGMMHDAPQLGRFISRLAERVRVVLVDRRGIGMSDPPADGAPVHLDHWVADVSAVLDALDAERVVLFAHENGGPVAIRLAVEEPQRIRAIALHSTAARPLRAPDHPYGGSEELVNRINRMIDGAPGALDLMTAVAPSAADDDELRAWLERAGRLGAGPARAKELHRTYFQSDVRDLLPLVHQPAVVLHPARVVVGDPGQARVLAEGLPDAELQILDSADHLFWLADADAVLAAIDRLVSRLAVRADLAPARLRALVGVAPPVGIDLLTDHGAEACLHLPGSVVAVFGSLAQARAALEAVTEAHPRVSGVVEVADTAATVADPSVIAVADAARESTGPP
jgi:pimeloyl-ACP methyl ester carboxylesterase/DNA-binding SARP family transcriptional activator